MDDSTAATAVSTIPNSSLRPSTQSRVAPATTTTTSTHRRENVGNVSTPGIKLHGTNGGSHYEFVVDRPIRRVYRSLKHTDIWIPFFFSYNYDGDRIDDNGLFRQGEVGVAYKANYYEITTSFAKDRVERFEITQWTKPTTAMNSGHVMTASERNAQANSNGNANVIDHPDDDDSNDNDKIGEIVITHRPNARSHPHRGLKQDIRITYSSLPDNTTLVMVNYPTSVRKYSRLSLLSLGLYKEYSTFQQYRIDSMNDFKLYLTA